MEDFSALAARVAAGVGDLRGCLILSRDGLVLGVFPEGQESLVKPAWLRFAVLGDPERGFVEFGDEVWAYARRGPYASFAVAGGSIRPGLLIDQLEQLLLHAEEIRAKRESLRIPDAAPAPTSKPRTPLHPELRPQTPAPNPVATAREAVVPTAAAAAPSAPSSVPAPMPTIGGGGAAGPSDPPMPTPSGAQRSPQPAAPSVPPASPDPAPPTPEPAPVMQAPSPPPTSEPSLAGQREDGDEIDPVLLAQEFSRLLQEGPNGDDG